MAKVVSREEKIKREKALYEAMTPGQRKNFQGTPTGRRAKEREDAAFKKTPLGKMQAIHDAVQKLDKKKKLKAQIAPDFKKRMSAADAAAVKDRLEQEEAGGVRRGRAKANAEKLRKY